MTYCFDILTGIHSDILSKILSGILSDTYSDILSGILSEICSDILSGIYSDILSDICSDFLSGVFSGILHVYMYLTFYLACVQVQAPSTASRAGDMVFGSRALGPPQELAGEEGVAPLLKSRDHHLDHLAAGE